MSQKTYRAAAIGHTGAGNYGHGTACRLQELGECRVYRCR